MKKELPKIYKGMVKQGCSNNLRYSKGIREEKKTPQQIINELFHENQIYRQNIEIETKEKKIETKIIGRTAEHIITINNEVIKIQDILNIQLKK